MKYLCAILAFLVLTLSVQPVCVAANTIAEDYCSDNHCSGNEEEGTDDREDSGCAGCNPFQLCGCCAFSVVPPLLLSLHFGEKPIYSDDSWTMHLCPVIEAPVLGFWQPPKIA